MKNSIEQYTDFIIRFRWWVVAGSVLLTLVWLIGASKLGVNTDLRIFFSKDNPQLLAFEAMENIYTKDDNIFIAIDAGDHSVFTQETLAVVEELTARAWEIPYSHRVDSITNFQNSYAQGDDLIVHDLVKNARDLSDDEIQHIKHIALSEPLLLNRLITRKENVTGINIDVIKPNAGTGDASAEISVFARNLVKEFKEKYPNLDFHLTGWIMLDTTMGEAAERDMKELIPAMFLLLIVVMGLSIRSLPGAVSTVIIIVLSMVTGMGVAGWMGIQITGPSSTAPPIIMTLALADSIHIFVTIFIMMYRGHERNQAIRESFKINMQPVFITSATTLLGFLSMNFSDAPPFRDLGNIIAIGIGAAFIYSVTLLPALAAILLPERKKEKKISETTSHMMETFSRFVVNRRQPVFWGTIIATLIVSLGITRIELNDDFIRYFDTSYTYRVDSEFVMDNLTGLYTIEYSLDSGKPKGVHDPAFLKHVEKFADWYANQPEVVHVNSLIPIIKKLNMNLNGDDPTKYRIPEDQSKIAQYLLLYELSLPFGHDLNNQINVDKSSLRLIVSLQDVTANDVRAIDERARAWLKMNEPPGLYTYGTGLAMMYAHLSQRNIKSMLAATLITLVLISLFLVFAFKSFKFGLLSLLPNLMPAVMAFGVWGLTIERIGIPASVLVSLAVGIVVDDTVHFISKYLHARRHHNLLPEDAIHYAFNTVGKALLITSATLIIGFSVLSMSGYKPNYDMGVMTTIIIALALMFDFLLVPTMILKLEIMKTDSLQEKE